MACEHRHFHQVVEGLGHQVLLHLEGPHLQEQKGMVRGWEGTVAMQVAQGRMRHCLGKMRNNLGPWMGLPVYVYHTL
jgi:hypothetical protein